MNKVSIIMPTYNASKYLDRSIKSVLNQSYENIEFIIIDDASTDNSKEIIKKYANLDSRIMPIYSEINNGVSKSRNLGLNVLSGDFVFFIDADDSIIKDGIKILLEKQQKYNADVVDSYHLIIKGDKKFLEHKELKEDLVLGDKTNIDMLTKSTYITGKLIKSNLLKGLYFDESLRRYEDLVFEHEIKQKLKKYVLIKDIIYYYYQIEGSLVNTLGIKHLVYMDAAKKVMDLYKDENKITKDAIESLLFTNAFLTGITKVIKNDNSIEENTKYLKDYFNSFKDVFLGYEDNKNINKIIKKEVNKFIKDDKNITSIIKKTKNINFIDLYFKYLGIVYKYKVN